MRKSVLYLATISSLFYLFQLEGTTAFLTSEKKHASAVSTGTNQDVFVTEAKQLVLKTEVFKKVKITKKKKEGAGPSKPGEDIETDVKVTIQRGADWITLFPQRPHLDLEVENFTVTGAAEDDVKIEKVESEDGEGITFKVYHDDKAIGRKNKTVTGQLHVTALGGFYHQMVPITVQTTYREKTDVEEVVVPDPTGPTPDVPTTPTTPGTPPTTPDTPPSPPPADDSTTPPPPATDTPTEPPTPPLGEEGSPMDSQAIQPSD
ncbi:hypothetical protein [Brevibacillus sp. H7]|uniref:hypothetical protein n=1 Tax=Brevibacillus sp. H7 TaxID=3349138 RepID=UPI003812FD29